MHLLLQIWCVSGEALVTFLQGLRAITYLSQIHNSRSEGGVVYDVALESASQRLSCRPNSEGEHLEEQCCHPRMSMPQISKLSCVVWRQAL